MVVSEGLSQAEVVGKAGIGAVGKFVIPRYLAKLQSKY